MKLNDNIIRFNKNIKSIIRKLIKEIPEFVTPPISLNESNHFSCFIATKTRDLESSRNRLKEITQYLTKLGFKILKPI